MKAIKYFKTIVFAGLLFSIMISCEEFDETLDDIFGTEYEDEYTDDSGN